jgi:DnaJ like chaperone protein
MKFTGKVVGGALGLLAGGPIGAAVGVLLGHQFDEYSQEPDELRLRNDANAAAIGDQFFRAAFRTMGHVAKSDGRVSESEIAAARAVMSDLRLTPPQVRAAIEYFTQGKQPEFDLNAELGALASICRGRPGLLRTFLEIQVRAALAGNNMEGPVRQLLGYMAKRLGVSWSWRRSRPCSASAPAASASKLPAAPPTSSCNRPTACWNASRVSVTTIWSKHTAGS